MRILFLTENTESFGLAKRLQDEGNTVMTFVREKTKAGNGVLERVDSWRNYLPDCDLVVCGTPGFSQYEDVFKKFGKPYIGGSRLGDLLIENKKKDFLAHCGVADCSNFEQKVTLHGFFNGRDWVKPLLVSVFDTCLFPGDLGPEVGCMGCTVKLVKQWPSFTEQIGEGLRKLGIKDLISIPFDDTLKVLGVGCGFIYDFIDALCEGIRENLSDFLFNLANGIPEGFAMTSDYVVVARLTIPPFPYSSPIDSEGIEIKGIDENNSKHLYLCDVYKEEEKYFACLGKGNTLKAAARGRDLREARRRVYRTLSNIVISNKQYRIDVGDRAENVLKSYPVKDLVHA